MSSVMGVKLGSLGDFKLICVCKALRKEAFGSDLIKGNQGVRIGPEFWTNLSRLPDGWQLVLKVPKISMDLAVPLPRVYLNRI